MHKKDWKDRYQSANSHVWVEELYITFIFFLVPFTFFYNKQVSLRKSYKIVITQFSAEFEVSKGKCQEGSFAMWGRAIRGTHGEWGTVDEIEGLSDKFVWKIGPRGVYRVLGGS